MTTQAIVNPLGDWIENRARQLGAVSLTSSNRVLVVCTKGDASGCGDRFDLNRSGIHPRVRQLLYSAIGENIPAAASVEWSCNTETLIDRVLGLDSQKSDPTLPAVIISTGYVRQRDPMGNGMTMDAVEELKQINARWGVPVVFIAPEDLRNLLPRVGPG
jgi:hypothetical protein